MSAHALIDRIFGNENEGQILLNISRADNLLTYWKRSTYFQFMIEKSL